MLTFIDPLKVIFAALAILIMLAISTILAIPVLLAILADSSWAHVKAKNNDTRFALVMSANISRGREKLTSMICHGN